MSGHDARRAPLPPGTLRSPLAESGGGLRPSGQGRFEPESDELVKMLEPGQILGQRFQLVQIIAVGTFGIVWHAEHLALRSPVAVKVLDPLSLKGEARQRFLTEARAAAALRSPHVVQILDCGVEGETPYIVMELLEGESLEARLARVSQLSVVETARLVRHVARAIDRARDAGIVHRDLKPGNVFIQDNDGDELVKVLDFGIARASHAAFESPAAGVTPAGVILGTPHYMSPEQASGAVDLDYRADIWSLGVIAYECLVGRPPRDGATVHEVLAAIISGTPVIPSENAAVPEGFDAWFARACAQDARARYESGKQAADQFLVICGVSPSATVEAPLESLLPLQRVRVRTGLASWLSRVLRLDHRRGEAKAKWNARSIGLPVKPTSVAWAAAAVSSVVAAWWFIDWRSDEAIAVQPPPSGIAVDSARLEASPPTASYAGPRPNESRGGEPVTPVASVTGAPSVPDDEYAARRAPPAAPGQSSAKAATGSRTSIPAPRPKQPARRAVSPVLDPLPPKPSPPRLVPDCRQPWDYDDQGRPQAKSECL